MLLLSEDLKDLEPIIAELVKKETYKMRKEIEILQSDIRALRAFSTAGQDE